MSALQERFAVTLDDELVSGLRAAAGSRSTAVIAAVRREVERRHAHGCGNAPGQARRRWPAREFRKQRGYSGLSGACFGSGGIALRDDAAAPALADAPVLAAKAGAG